MAFVAKYTRSDGQWCVEIPRAKEFTGWSSSLARLRRAVQKGISEFYPDLADEEMREQFELPADAQQTLREIQNANTSVERAQSRALEIKRRGARRLQRKLGLSNRDLGSLMGISGTQAQQLLKAAR